MKKKTEYIGEEKSQDKLYMTDEKEKNTSVKVPKKSTGIGIKVLSVILCFSLCFTMFAVVNSNYRDIFRSFFDRQEEPVIEPQENISSEESSFVIPSDVIEIEINNEKPNYSTGDENTPLNDISFKYNTAYLDAGNSTRLRYTKEPLEADTSDLKWVSSDSSVLAVSNLGTVTGVSEGQAVVSLYSLKYDVEASCTIYVKAEEKEDGVQTVIPSDGDDETGFFTPPEDDEDGEITNNISSIVSVNPPPVSSQEQSLPSFAPSVTVSQMQSEISSQIISSAVQSVEASSVVSKEPPNSSLVSSNTPQSTVTSIPPVSSDVSNPSGTSSDTSDTSSNPDAQSIADKLIKVKQKDGSYVAVTVLDYLMYNTAVEMDSRFSDEAVKAQIVCIYTYYIIYNMSRGASYATMEGSRVFKFNEDGSVDFSKAKYHWPEQNGSFERLKRLCMEVLGEAVLYNGDGACAVFSHINRGASQASSPFWGSEKIPYLTVVDSPWDKESNECKRVRTIDKDTVYQKLSELVGEENLTMDPEYWFYEIARDVPDEGYVNYLTIGEKTVSGYKVRSKFSFRSNCFFAEYDKENEVFTFTVYGNGHGIGLSQVGAEGMANDGHTWQEILMHYFPKTEIKYKEPTFYNA